MSALATIPHTEDIGEKVNADLSTMTIGKCVVGGFELRLFSDPLVFKPTLTTLLLTEQVLRVGLTKRTVLDLGCGSAPIAIALALNGARHVHAADLMPQACELAIKNVKLNCVEEKVTVLNGDLFEPVRHMKFDIIVDDMSGVAEEVAKLSSWFPPEVPLGGPDGAELTIRMLEKSKQHLNDGGHLFFPVLSLSNSARIISTAREVYGDRLKRVASKLVPFNHQLKENHEALVRLRDLGTISFEQIRSRLFWSLEIFRADMGGRF